MQIVVIVATRIVVFVVAHVPVSMISEKNTSYLVGKMNTQAGEVSIFYSSFENKVILYKKRKIFREFFLQQFPQMKNTPVISIFVTTYCNLNCKYCYAKNNLEKEAINEENIKLFIDWFMKKFPSIDHIRFQGGGEPTLFIDKIKKIVEICKEYGIKKFGIQTNMTFSRETCKWIAENFNYVFASIDGPPEIQFFHRGINSELNKIVEYNTKFLISAGVDVPVKCTISKFSNKKQKEIIDYLHSLNVKFVVMEPIFLMGNAEKSVNDFNTPPDLKDFLSKFIYTKIYAEKKGMTVISPFLPFEQFGEHYCGACGYPERFPCLTTDGFISVCDEHFKNDNSIFIIGKLQNKRMKIFKDRLNILKLRSIKNMDNCKNCFLKWRCRGQCPSRVLDETGNIFSPKKDKCDIIKKYSKKYIKLKVREFLNAEFSIQRYRRKLDYNLPYQ